uniref:WSSV038 n=1 Tax=White spot syndrome virus TaxID=342409 RepID=A0A3G5BHG9_9VIRU|nr:wssv076 [White spot syndrome virus]AYV99361.1 WSSV038 [White spot syndrome virus]
MEEVEQEENWLMFFFDVVVVVGDGNYGNTVAVCSSCS